MTGDMRKIREIFATSSLVVCGRGLMLAAVLMLSMATPTCAVQPTCPNMSKQDPACWNKSKHVQTCSKLLSVLTGGLDDAVLLGPILFLTPSSFCLCSAACLVRPNCASFSYGGKSDAQQLRQCRLYKEAGSLTSLQAGRLSDNVTSRFSIIPGRSRLRQFCRIDQDCVSESSGPVSCRGCHCSNDNYTMIACRGLNLQGGRVVVKGRYASEIFRFICDGSFTLVHRTEYYLKYDQLATNGTHSIWWRTSPLDPFASTPYSLLAIAAELIVSLQEPTYNIRLTVVYMNSLSNQKKQFTFSATAPLFLTPMRSKPGPAHFLTNIVGLDKFCAVNELLRGCRPEQKMSHQMHFSP